MRQLPFVTAAAVLLLPPLTVAFLWAGGTSATRLLEIGSRAVPGRSCQLASARGGVAVALCQTTGTMGPAQVAQTNIAADQLRFGASWRTLPRAQVNWTDPRFSGSFVARVDVIPYPVLLVMSSVPLLLLLAGRAAAATRRQRRIHRNLCPNCGYDLRASPDRCPECGATTTRTGTIAA
jgi:hypothetical protein